MYIHTYIHIHPMRRFNSARRAFGLAYSRFLYQDLFDNNITGLCLHSTIC